MNSNNNTCCRKRNLRQMLAFAAVLCWPLSLSSALSSRTTTGRSLVLDPQLVPVVPITSKQRTTENAATKTTAPRKYRSSDDSSSSSTKKRRIKLVQNGNSKSSITEQKASDYDDDDDDDDLLKDSLQDYVSTYRTLQQSTGHEVLPADLQRQIDTSASNLHFLDQHVTDATYLEKVAMSSITEQLPQAAVRALLKRNNNSKQTREESSKQVDYQQEQLPARNKKSNNNNKVLPNRFQRVTPEKEVELARLIQQGVELLRLRTTKEDQLGRSISRLEWANLANLSTRELRRRVSDYRNAKHELVAANMGLVHAIVNQQYSTFYSKSGITKDELVQEGSLGLLRAAELFDPERGLRFSTYAVVWIKGTLSNTHLPELVRLPAREKTKWNKISTAIAEANRAGQASVSAEELAAMTGIPLAQVVETQRKMTQTRNMYSLDYQYTAQSRSGSETSNSFDSVLLNNDKNLQDDVDLTERTQLRADIIAAMARNLDAREARLMRLRYGLSDGQERSLAECADAMGVSETRVKQLATRCLQKLRQAAEASSLEEYLLTIA